MGTRVSVRWDYPNSNHRILLYLRYGVTVITEILLKLTSVEFELMIFYRYPLFEIEKFAIYTHANRKIEKIFNDIEPTELRISREQGFSNDAARV